MKEPIPVELLEKYVNGTCTELEAAKVKNWYLSFEDEHDHVSTINVAEEEELEQRIYNHILHNIGLSEGEEEEVPVVRSRSTFLRVLYSIAGAAAAIVLVAGSFLLYRNHKTTIIQSSESTTEQLVSVTNNTGQIYKAILPDKSAVWLNPLAQLTYPKVFGTKSRIVTISGECFFEVTKNPNCPFIINSRAIVTKVWGTSFLVRDNDRSNSAEVSVLTGKVSVSIKKTDNADHSALVLEKGDVMLYPHQKAIYLIDQHILKPEVEKVAPELQIWKRVNLLFENKPLREIIPVLNANYHVHIKASSEKLNHYILNADLEGFNLPDVLEALKKSLNVNYEIEENEITLE
ncbi:MAG: FecR family protein [Bacteroidota bacterium]|nr:FecR family protein [Bacteroidota bacterium]